jgi:hypothetical protein
LRRCRAARSVQHGRVVARFAAVRDLFLHATYRLPRLCVSDVHSIVPQTATEVSVACEFRSQPESLRLRASHAVVPYVRVAPCYLVRPRRVGFGRVGPRGGGGSCGRCKRERKSEDGHGGADRQASVRPGRWASFHWSLLSIVRNGGAVQHPDSLPGPRNPRVSVRSRGPYRGTHAHRGRRRPRRHGRSWTLCSRRVVRLPVGRRDADGARPGWAFAFATPRHVVRVWLPARAALGAL